MLVRVENISVMAIDEVRNARDFTFLVRASYKQDGGILHEKRYPRG